MLATEDRGQCDQRDGADDHLLAIAVLVEVGVNCFQSFLETSHDGSPEVAFTYAAVVACATASATLSATPEMSPTELPSLK